MSSFLNQITTIGLDDLKMFVTYVLIYAVYRYILTHYVFSPLGHLAKIDPKRNYKWSNRCFDLLHYSTSALLGLVAILGRPYARCLFWAKGYEDLIVANPEAFECTVAEKMYVLMFLCYYIVDATYVATQSDMFFIVLHHIATISLITGSIYLRQAPVCVTIMVLHDIVDVPLYLGKIATYLGYKNVKDVSLVSFAILCTWFRIINYPILSYQASMQSGKANFQQKFFKLDSMFLWVLYACHLKWFGDILYAVKGIIQKDPNAIRDNRSD